jgi:hypothetical protein
MIPVVKLLPSAVSGSSADFSVLSAPVMTAEARLLLNAASGAAAGCDPTPASAAAADADAGSASPSKALGVEAADVRFLA